MLIAVSGSQGSGKSTVLSALESKGYTVMQRKISRSILHDWNVSLEEVNTDPILTLKFQDEILERKLSDEADHVNSSEIVFTERTFLDSYVFYMFSFGNKHDFIEHITDYHTKCVVYDRSYTNICMIPSGKFAVVDDGVRNSNNLYAESIDIVLRHNLATYYDTKTYNIDSVSVEARVEEILKKIK